MVPHDQIDVVHRADADEFTFPAEIADLPLFGQLLFEFQVHALLCRNRHKNRRTVQSGFDLRIRQRDGGAQYAGELGMMPAAMRRAGFRIGMRSVGNRQGVQFAHDGHPHVAPPGAGQAAFYAGHRHPFLGRHAQCFHLGRELLGSAVFFIPQLCVVENIPAKRFDLFGMFLNHLEDPLFQCIHFSPSFLPPAGRFDSFFHHTKSSLQRQCADIRGHFG